jgi:hypothetical protein
MAIHTLPEKLGKGGMAARSTLLTTEWHYKNTLHSVRHIDTNTVKIWLRKGRMGNTNNSSTQTEVLNTTSMQPHNMTKLSFFHGYKETYERLHYYHVMLNMDKHAI